MRKIQFRGKCSHCDAWVYGSLVDFGEDEAPEIHGFDPYREGDERWREIAVDRDTIGQFTGLYDKNGKEVYEGDILLLKDLKPLWDDQTVVVGWSEFGARFETGGFNIRLCTVNEIIGNVFDNKELLKR